MISKTPNPSKEADLDQLVQEICDQIRRGENVDLDSVIRQYPEWETRLRKIHPTILAMAQWGGDYHDSTAVQFGSLENREIGDFQINRQIGRGGMGVVYEAQQLSIRRRVALKVLPMAALVDSRALQRFKNEVTAIATVEHPNIVSVYAVGEERGIHYYAMQLIRGQSLATVIRELQQRADQQGSISGEQLDRLVSDMEESAAPADQPTSPMDDPANAAQEPAEPETQARGQSRTSRSVVDPAYFRNVARLIQQAAEALQHAHDHGIVHRDVKPGNLLLDAQGTLYVTDFGLARIETGAGVTMTGDVMGTLRYMSPEQVLANRVVVDHRTDVYSLGATLYELLALQPMWSGDDRPDVIRQISFEEPTAPRKLNPAIPPDLETIVLKAIEKNPNDRYESVQLFANDLQSYLDHQPILARRASVVQRLNKWSRRNPAIMWSAMTTLIVVIAALALSTFMITAALRKANENQEIAYENIQETLKANQRIETIHNFVLGGIVRSAKPSNESGDRDITVRESLLSVYDLIDDQFRDDPVLKSHVKAEFGEYLESIGEYELARSALENALAEFLANLGEENRHVIETRLKLIDVYHALGELDAGLSASLHSVAITNTLCGQYHPDTIRSLFRLGTIYSKRRQLPEAIATLDDAADRSRKAGLSDLEALSEMELGNVYFYRRDMIEAESYWLEALNQFDDSEDRSNILLIKANLAKLYWSTGRRGDSLMLSMEVVEGMNEVYGTTHPLTISALQDLASHQYYEKEYEAAISNCRRLVAAIKTHYGLDHPRTAKAMTDLGTALRSKGEFDESIEWLESALSIIHDRFGKNDSKTLYTLGSLAQTYAKQGNFEKAADYFQQTIDARLVILSNAPENQSNKVSLGGVYCNYGIVLRDELSRADEAIGCFTRAIELLQPIVDEKAQLFLTNNYAGRADTYAQLGEWDKAFSDADQAIDTAVTYGRKTGMRSIKARLLALAGRVDECTDLLSSLEPESPRSSELYFAARVMALCATSFRNNDEVNIRAKFADYAQQSIELLCRANDLDPDSFEKLISELKTETDFDGIRELPEFQSLYDRFAAVDDGTGN